MAKENIRASELTRLFETARKDVPSPSQQRELEQAVLSAVRTGLAPSQDWEAPPSGGGAHPGSVAAKVLGSVGAVAIVAAGVAQLRGTAPETLDRSRSALPVASISSAVQARPSASDTPSAERSRSEAPAGSVEALNRETAEDTAPRPIVSARRTSALPPPSETSLIDRAQRQLSTNPQEALTLTQTHRRLYPRGVLAQEREVIAIEALSRLGQAREAQQRAESYRTGEPHSIHELRLRRVLGDAGTESEP